MNELKIQFGRSLKAIRKQINLTQEQLAETVGVSVEFISNIERGINAPSFKTLENLSRSDLVVSPPTPLFTNQVWVS